MGGAGGCIREVGRKRVVGTEEILPDGNDYHGVWGGRVHDTSERGSETQ